MNATERFIRDQNLDRFTALIEATEDGGLRDMLCRLAVEEEDRYGTLLERLAKADELIVRAEARVQLLTQLFQDHAAPERAALHDGILANVAAALAMFRDYRRTLVEAADRSGL